MRILTELSRAKDAYRVKDYQITTLGEQIAEQSTQIVDLKAVIAEQAAQQKLDLRLAEATVRAKNEKIATLDNRIATQATEMVNLNDRVATMAAQEQDAAKAFTEKEAECMHWRKKWCELERAQLTLEQTLRDCQQELESSRMENINFCKKREEDKAKSDNVLQRESDRKKNEISGYKEKIADLESQLHSQTGIVEKANADLDELRRQQRTFKQGSERHQKEKSELESKIHDLENGASAAWQQVAVLQSEIDKYRIIYSRMRDLVEIGNLSPVETDVGLSQSADQA